MSHRRSEVDAATAAKDQAAATQANVNHDYESSQQRLLDERHEEKGIRPARAEVEVDGPEATLTEFAEWMFHAINESPLQFQEAKWGYDAQFNWVLADDRNYWYMRSSGEYRCEIQHWSPTDGLQVEHFSSPFIYGLARRVKDWLDKATRESPGFKEARI